jgi:hypothetical protein
MPTALSDSISCRVCSNVLNVRPSPRFALRIAEE